MCEIIKGKHFLSNILCLVRAFVRYDTIVLNLLNDKFLVGSEIDINSRVLPALPKD